MSRDRDRVNPLSGLNAKEWVSVPEAEGKGPRSIPLSLIDPNPDQPRRKFQAIDELALSLEKRGQLQPILVRQVAGRYTLVAGERRYRAAQQLGWSHIAAEVADASRTDGELFEDAVAENLQREDLSAVELAEAFRWIAISGEMLKPGVAADAAREEPSLVRLTDVDVPALAKRVGRPRRFVERHLRLLGAHPRLVSAMRDHAVSYGIGEELLGMARHGRKGLERALRLARRQTITRRDAKEARQASGRPPRRVPLFAVGDDGEVRVRSQRLRPDASGEDLDRLLEQAEALVETLRARLSDGWPTAKSGADAPAESGGEQG